MSDFKTFQFFLKKSFAKIKTDFKVKILNLIKQWQQLESNPSIRFSILCSSSLPLLKVKENVGREDAVEEDVLKTTKKTDPATRVATLQLLNFHISRKE